MKSDAEGFELPYTVLVGRDSDIIDVYQITKLPRLIIVGKDGMIALTEKFLPFDRLKEQVESAVR